MQVREECGRLVYHMTEGEYADYLNRGIPLTDDDDQNIEMLLDREVPVEQEDGSMIRVKQSRPIQEGEEA